MALPKSPKDREYKKFVEVAGSPAVKVSLVAGGFGGFTPASYDTVTVTYPDTVTEVYTFTLAAVSQGVITVTYTTSSKEFISTVVRT